MNEPTKPEQAISKLLLLYTFLLPWQARYIWVEYSRDFPYYGDLSCYVTDALFVLIVILWIVWLIRRRTQVFQIRQLSKRTKIIIATVFVFIIFSGLSIFWAPHMLVSFLVWTRLLQAILLMAMIATVPIRIRAILLAIILSGFIQAMWAISQFLNQEINPSTWLGMSGQNPKDLGVSVIEYRDQRWLRAYGMLPHPNILGGLLALAGLAVSGWYFSVHQLIHKWSDKWDQLTRKQLKAMRLQIFSTYASFAFIIIGLLFTFSRSAWLGFAIAWLALFVMLLRHSEKGLRRLIAIAGAKLIGLGLIILLVLSYTTGPLWTHRASDSSRVAQISVNQRQELFDQGKNIIGGHIVLGAGIGGYLPEVMAQWPDRGIFNYQPVHNLWMFLWAELGIVGLAIFALWLGMILFWIKRLLKSDRVSLEEAVVYAGLIGIGLIAYFEHYWWSLPFGLLTAAIWIGLLINGSKNKQT